MTQEDLRIARQITGASKPKSVCTCGHAGDGPYSRHGGLIGHGHCLVKGCGCQKFTFSRLNPYGEKLVAKARAKARAATGA